MTRLLVVLGLALRLFHFLRNPSVWHDEAAVLVNVLERNFLELLGPLRFAEAAPPLFLWAERASALLFGESTYALRLLPFLASCGSLLLLAWLAHRLLPPRAVSWAVLLFACSEMLLWHSCEAKPYALDVFAAVSLLALFVLTQGWPLGRQLFVFLPVAPLAIFLCYPGCFLCGGLLLALLPAVYRGRRWTSWLQYAGLALLIGGSFLALYFGPVRAQHNAAIESCWPRQFPDWNRPWRVPDWTFFSTLEVVRYCCEPTGTALAPLAALGALTWWRQRRRRLLVLGLAPLGLALVASFLRAYPYGGVRVVVYAAPILILLIAAGVPVAEAWLRRRHAWARLPLYLVLLAPVELAGQLVLLPWDRADCAGAAAFVRSHSRPGDVVTGSSWEYLYYFRHTSRPYVPMLEWDRRPPAGRVWMLVSATAPEVRQLLEQQFTPPAWRARLAATFEATDVLLLRPPRALAAPAHAATTLPGGRSVPPRNRP
jgi:MYXO-CTERM domain-containing protein